MPRPNPNLPPSKEEQLPQGTAKKVVLVVVTTILSVVLVREPELLTTVLTAVRALLT